MQRHGFRIMGLAALLGLGLGAGCNKNAANPLGDIAGQCGFACPGDKDDKGVVIKGIADGNANISGVASIDGFFSSVVNFNNAATNVSAGIDAQLEAIRADFGIDAKADLAAELKTKLDASFEGGIKSGLTITMQPAQCAVDAHATIEATAKCDASVTGPKATVQCKGSCELDAKASAMCDASATMQCSFTDPSVMCGGSCSGSCDVSAGATCDGSCSGTCTGTCSVKNADGSCAGKCDGMCKGSCTLNAGAMCMGQCKGECTAKAPSGGCMADAKVSCKASASASASCSGKCDGDFEPPMAKAECQASAKADASVNVQCTPPQLKVDYTLAASLQGTANAAARAKFEAAFSNLVTLRLPALLEAAGRAKFVARAGEGLVSAAEIGVKTSVDGALSGKLGLKATFGLGCALGQLKDVKSTLDVSTADLTKSLQAAGDISSTLNIPG